MSVCGASTSTTLSWWRLISFSSMGRTRTTTETLSLTARGRTEWFRPWFVCDDGDGAVGAAAVDEEEDDDFVARTVALVVVALFALLLVWLLLLLLLSLLLLLLLLLRSLLLLPLVLLLLLPPSPSPPRCKSACRALCFPLRRIRDDMELTEDAAAAPPPLFSGCVCVGAVAGAVAGVARVLQPVPAGAVVACRACCCVRAVLAAQLLTVHSTCLK